MESSYKTRSCQKKCNTYETFFEKDKKESTKKD